MPCSWASLLWRRSARHVRRDKAAHSSGCKAHQPEATEAGMEETKCLKPSVNDHEFGECAGRNVT